MDFEELVYRMGYDSVIYLYYNTVENAFYDEYGFRITNVFEIITPNNLFLFKQDPGYCIFQHKDNHRILCEIITDE